MSTPADTTVSEPLRMPVQPRARATFAKILDASISILASDGLNALNTNRIAEEAGINVATLYSYFANKESILAYLATRFEEARATSIEEHAKTLGLDDNWEQWYIESIDSMVTFRLKDPSGLVVRQALMAMPDLNEIDRMSTQRATEAKIPGILRIAPHLTIEHARRISHVYTLSVTAVLDEAFRSSPHDAEMVDELKRMVIMYLRSHFNH